MEVSYSESEDTEIHENGTHQPSGSGKRREKKTRVSTACLACRRRKSKCDGKSPCSGCTLKGLTCEVMFDDRRRKQPPAQGSSQDLNDVRSLKERCKYLERLVLASKRHESEEDGGDDGGSAFSMSGGSASQSSSTVPTATVSLPVISPSHQVTASKAPLITGESRPLQSISPSLQVVPSQPSLTGDIRTMQPRINPIPSFSDKITQSPVYSTNHMTMPQFQLSTNVASYQAPSGSTSANFPSATSTSTSTWQGNYVKDATSNLQALSSTLNISNLNTWSETSAETVRHPTAITSYPQLTSSLAAEPLGTGSGISPPAASNISGSNPSPSPVHANRPLVAPPPQSLTEEDMIEPMPRNALETIHAGKATPAGIETGSLAHQLARRDGRMTLADGGKLRYYGATSARSLSYGGLHFQSRGRKQVRDLNATCRMALNKAGYLPDSIFEDYGFQQRIVALFFQWVNAFFVTVREDVFYRQWARYRAVQDGNSHKPISPEEGQHFSLLLLYSMLAVAAPMSDEAIHKSECGDAHETAGDIFAACARICLDEEIDLPQETTVQALAILASREVTVGKDARGYAYIGMATSCALDLGLNTDVTVWLDSGHVTKEQYQVRQTTWWGLFLYEKLWALYVGRPSLCRQVAVTVPLPEAPEQSDSNPFNTIETRSNLDFVCRLVELLRITDSIVDTLYSPFSQFEKSASELKEWSHDVLSQLNAWLNGLTPALQVDYNGDANFCNAKPNVLVLHMQYQVTIINLFRPFTCDIQSQKPRYNDAFQICAKAANALSFLIDRYRIKYTLRRITLVAIHQFFTAASFQVFIIYACMLGCTPPESTAAIQLEAQKCLLTCLGGLAAIATSQIHARRSYLMVVLLMKRWGITLNPAYASSEADNVFQQTKSAGAALQLAPTTTGISKHQAQPSAQPNPNTGIWTTSEGFASISQELFALCGDGMFDNSRIPQQPLTAHNASSTTLANQPNAFASTSVPEPTMASTSTNWNHVMPTEFSNEMLMNPTRPVGSFGQDAPLTDDQLKLFDFGLGSFNSLLSPTNGMNLLDWERPSLADIFDLSTFTHT